MSVLCNIWDILILKNWSVFCLECKFNGVPCVSFGRPTHLGSLCRWRVLILFCEALYSPGSWTGFLYMVDSGQYFKRVKVIELRNGSAVEHTLNMHENLDSRHFFPPIIRRKKRQRWNLLGLLRPWLGYHLFLIITHSQQAGNRF
jgi:hypothetical protein